MNLLHAAIYARVSSDQQAAAHTIASQVAALQERVALDGLVLPDTMQFLDEGYSGATLVRPALERLRDVIAAGAIDRLYGHSPDRLARKYAYQVLLVDEFQWRGVEVVFLNRELGRSPEDDLLLQVQGMMAEYERAKIVERHRRGKLHAARAGVVNVLSGAPYGYRYVDQYLGGGQARYEVVPDEARVVRQVFDWVGHERLSIGEVCRRLTAAGEVTRTGKMVWDRSVVWGILHNPAYKGAAAFGKTRQGPLRPRLRAQRGRPLQPRRAVSIQDVPPEERLTIAVPALVDTDLFGAVQAQLQENQRHARQSRRGARYLLQGLVQCHHCGYAFYGKPISRKAAKGHARMYASYRCLGTDAYRFGGERVCTNPQVRTDLVDLAVWQEVCALLAHPERLAEEYRRRLHAPGRTKRQEQPTLDAQIGKLRQGLARLIDSYAEGLIDKQEFEPRITRLRQRLTALEAQAQQLQDEAALHTELRLIIGRLEDFAAQVHTGLAAADWASKRELIRALVKRVEVTQDQVNVVFRVDQHSTEPGPGKKSVQPRRGSTVSDLWRTLVGVQQRARLPYARVQPLANQSEYASILDPLLDQCPQMAPVQVVDTSTDIRISSPGDVQRPTLLPQLVQRLMGTVPLPEAMGERREIMLEDRLQDHHDRPLADLVLEAGFPYRPLLPPCLLDPHPCDWRRLIPVVAAPCMQIPQVLVQALGVLLRRDVVHAWGTALLGLVQGFPEELPVDQVKHIIAHHCWIALGLWRTLLALHGYGG